MNTPENLALLQAAAQGLRDSWDAMAALRVNLGIHEDDDNNGDMLEHKVEDFAGDITDGAELDASNLQELIDNIGVVDHEQQPA